MTYYLEILIGLVLHLKFLHWTSYSIYYFK